MHISLWPSLLTLGLLYGCMGGGSFSDPVTDTLAKTPLMYKPDIQQGNVLSQEDVNKLQPGMSTEQVRFIMGTPLIQDTFNQNRWDYVYSMKRGGNTAEKKRVALIFQDDQLVEIKGDYRPDSTAEPFSPDTVVSIPDNKAKRGLVKGALSTFGLGDDIPQPKKKAEGAAKQAVTTPVETQPAQASTETGTAQDQPTGPLTPRPEH